jgi:hypothetical protein
MLETRRASIPLRTGFEEEEEEEEEEDVRVMNICVINEMRFRSSIRFGLVLVTPRELAT